MSYTATATRGIAPTSLNLNIFSHPPSRQHHASHHANHSANHQMDRRCAKTPTSLLTDDEDIFSLDMVTMDMDFDQAYSMYTLMQQKNALMGIEQLQAAQQMNMNNTFAYGHRGGQDVHGSGSGSNVGASGLHHSHNRSQAELQSGEASANSASPLNEFCAPQMMSQPSYFGGAVTPPLQSIHHDTIQNDTTHNEIHDDSMDQFFSNTELNALEKFLDRLALLNSLDPLAMYNTNVEQPKMTSLMFDLHTMSAMENRAVKRDIPDVVKKEITDVFKHPPQQSLRSFASPSQINTQLPTPVDSRQSSTTKRTYEDLLPPLSPLLKKKRKLNKPLLSLEQKRLNHSHSEQKRRLLCKEAYERCLRLITNVEDYKNDLVSALAVTSSKKKSKRKQINKDGLPNLSKHTALCKISEEIEKISSKNMQLRALLDGNNGFR